MGLRSERVDDIPLLVGQLERMGVPRLLDEQYGRHGNRQGLATGWLARPWYRAKATPSFLDMLTAVRQKSWRRYFSDPPSPGPATQKSALSWAHDLLATA